MWAWTVGLIVVGGTVLLLTIHAFDTWVPSADSVAVLTLDQLLGFVISALLLITAVLVLLTGIRGGRNRRTTNSRTPGEAPADRRRPSGRE
jgi:hypothetical protein